MFAFSLECNHRYQVLVSRRMNNQKLLVPYNFLMLFIHYLQVLFMFKAYTILAIQLRDYIIELDNS